MVANIKKAFEKYQKEPNEASKQKLKEAYEAIPEQNRVYVLGDMNQKDNPIRSVIYDE